MAGGCTAGAGGSGLATSSLSATLASAFASTLGAGSGVASSELATRVGISHAPLASKSLALLALFF
ncbi:MAG: hypothetical protein P1P90_05000 [Patescibacteria group bacterium]|nr:hypothetical protein [Patescibacteria group bacterium]